MSHTLCLQENVNCKRTSYFSQNGFYQGTTATLGTATMENSMDVPYRRQPCSMSQLHHSPCLGEPDCCCVSRVHRWADEDKEGTEWGRKSSKGMERLQARMMREEKVTHAFFQTGSLDSYMLKHTFMWVHTCAHTSTLESRGISGNVGARKWFLQKRVGRDICTCTKTAQWSSWFCALNKSGDHGSTSDQILLSPWRPKITHAYQTDWAGQTLGTVSVPEATTHIVSEFL